MSSNAYDSLFFTFRPPIKSILNNSQIINYLCWLIWCMHWVKIEAKHTVLDFEAEKFLIVAAKSIDKHYIYFRGRDA